MIEHWSCIDWSVTVFQSMEFVNWITCVKYLFTNSLSQLTSCLLWRCMLLVFVFRCLVCCRRISGVPQFGYCYCKGILEKLLAWNNVGMILFFHVLSPMPWNWELGGFSFLYLSLVFGKNYFVTSPFVELFNCSRHFSMLFSLSWCSISLFGIFFVTHVISGSSLASMFP
jgi:hypothetical protein